MENSNNDQCGIEMNELCSSVKAFVMDGDYESGINMIYKSMSCFPHSPQPHNLLAIILDKKGKHHEAKKHFHAALALDPDYLPAKYNINVYGSCLSQEDYAFDESDVTLGESGNIEIVYDSRNIGHAVYKRKIELIKHGAGRVTRK